MPTCHCQMIPNPKKLPRAKHSTMRLYVILTILCLGEASPKDSILLKDRNRARGKVVKVSKPRDLCTMDSDNNKMRCICNNEKNQRVTSAECWLFGALSADDYLWELVRKSQPYLSDYRVVAGNQDHLKRIPHWFVTNMVYLKNLSISYSHLEHLPEFTISNSSALKELDLSNNKIEHLDPYAISNLSSLKSIDLRQNKIKAIRQNVFFRLPQLTTVFLNRNNISQIDDKAFEHMANVLELDLSENNICDINTSTFYGLSHLKVIDMSFNKLVSLSSSIFSELWDLEDLFLDYNFIQFISNRAFDGLSYLKTISLSNNRLTSFPPGSLTSIYTLLNLDLSNNRLDTLVLDSIEPFYKKLTHNGTIDLKGNNFRCDCRLEWVYILYQRSINQSLKASLRKIQCSQSDDRAISATEITGDAVCPGPGRILAEEPDLQNEISLHDRKSLLSIPENDLPCPNEYRPTPITVKQSTTLSPETLSSVTSNNAVVPCVVVVVVGLSRVL